MFRQGMGIHDAQAAFVKKVAKEKKISFSQAHREVLQVGVDTMKKLRKTSK